MSAQQVSSSERAAESAGMPCRRPGRPAAANPEGKMPVLGHVRELRNRVLKALLAVVAGGIIGWLLYPHIWHFIEQPYCRLPQSHFLPGTHTSVLNGHRVGCTLYVTGIFDAFFLRLKISVIAGIILSSPFWLYQLWAFIAPGLYRKERRWAYFFGASAVPLFAIGGTIAYFAMTKGLHFLLGLVPNGVSAIITIDTYLGYAIAMLAIFGVAFEVPLVVVLLNQARVLTHARFRKHRRLIIFLVFGFAAIFTPSPDPLSMLLLAVPCVVLIEVAEVFIYFHDRRLARAGTVYPGLTAEDQAMLDDGTSSGVSPDGEVGVKL